MAGLTFETYSVDKMIYHKNENFIPTDDGEVDLDPSFDIVINKTEKEAIVDMNFSVGSMTDKTSPFCIKVCISGIFFYNVNEAEDEPFESFLKTNAVAILFPYLRQIVSNLTTVTNEFPTFILPVMNIVKYLEDEDNIIIKELD
ncbi:protein-export chaperone SecB [Jeotgalicoccus huakuii]|nr:protein-export chaperone SecB [Jeotgalicoccus huakuii]